MTRVKRSIQPIENQRQKLLSFKKRSDGVMKKALELSILCDVQVCVIIYGPDEHGPTLVWPKDSNLVLDLIRKYKEKSSIARGNRNVGISRYFEERNRKVENALANLRKKSDAACFPKWDVWFASLPEHQLRDIFNLLENKLALAKIKLDLMKKSEDNSRGYSTSSSQNQVADESLNNSFQDFPQPLAMIPLDNVYFNPLMTLNSFEDFPKPAYLNSTGDYLDQPYQPLSMIKHADVTFGDHLYQPQAMSKPADVYSFDDLHQPMTMMEHRDMNPLITMNDPFMQQGFYVPPQLDYTPLPPYYEPPLLEFYPAIHDQSMQAYACSPMVDPTTTMIQPTSSGQVFRDQHLLPPLEYSKRADDSSQIYPAQMDLPYGFFAEEAPRF